MAPRTFLLTLLTLSTPLPSLATSSTSPANILLHLSPNNQHPLGPTSPAKPSPNNTPSSKCLTTKTGTATITSGLTDPQTRLPTYALTTQVQTLIHECDPPPTPTAKQTTTQILHLQISYAPEASLDPMTADITNTWVQYPPDPSLARSYKELGTQCQCPGKESGWEPDRRCGEKGLKTGCSVQCGFFRKRFTCLVGSDNPKEFFEGRVCFGDGVLEYLGEPCHVGDVMMHCEECV